jgi:peptidyl-tRNA hydrolase, PTH2 family
MEGRQVKQVIVIRRDLKMRRGKEIAQGAHASMAWLVRRIDFPNRLPYPDEDVFYLNDISRAIVFSEAELAWLGGSFRKITCQVQSEADLSVVAARARELGVQVHVITDAGLTEFGGVPTVTACAIGPDWEDLVDQVTGELPLY